MTMYKCMVCGSLQSDPACKNCVNKAVQRLYGVPFILRSLDRRMNPRTLDIDEKASWQAHRVRAMIHGWSLVAAELRPRTPEIDSALSKPEGQCALIREMLRPPTGTPAPPCLADCVEEVITTTTQANKYLTA